MEHLYRELWGKDPQLPIVENVVLKIPMPQYGIRPGYKIPIEPAKMGRIFPSPGSSPVGEKEVKIIRVDSRVPVGKQKLLARSEYDDIIDKLALAEGKRFSASGALDTSAKRDFQVAGQPGCGM